MTFYVKRGPSSSKEELEHSDDELQHFGILGMKWGIRRFQNKDGSYTKEGKKRYGIETETDKKNREREELFEKQYRIEHDNDDSSTTKNIERFVHYRDNRHKVDPVLLQNIVDKNSNECKKYAQTSEEYYNYLYDKAPEFALEVIRNVFGKNPTAEDLISESWNDWDSGDINAWLKYTKKDKNFDKIYEEWLEDGRKLSQAISSEMYKYLGENQVIKYDDAYKIQDEIVKSILGETEFDMGLRASDRVSETMRNEAERLSNKIHHHDINNVYQKNVANQRTIFYAKRDFSSDEELQHHGILGMKWGVRRYQNPDGSLTDAGRKRYGVSNIENAKVGTKIKNGYFRDEKGKKIAAKDERGYFTQEYTDLAEREAHDENKYNLDFLKMINDSYISNDREAMLKEYNKFLKDKTYDAPKALNESKDGYTNEYKDYAMKVAKEKDSYNLEFIERIQNKIYLGDNSPKGIQKRFKEYKKYLNDPFNYRPPEGDEE